MNIKEGNTNKKKDDKKKNVQKHNIQKHNVQKKTYIQPKNNIKSLSNAELLKAIETIYDKKSNSFTKTFITYLNGVLTKVSGKTIENIVNTINTYILYLNPKYTVSSISTPKDGKIYSASFDQIINNQLKIYKDPVTITSKLSQATYQTKQEFIYVANKCVEYIIKQTSSGYSKTNPNVKTNANTNIKTVQTKSFFTKLYEIWYPPI
jgi:hypothetical protein